MTQLEKILLGIIIILLLLFVFRKMEHYSKSSISNDKIGLKIENIRTGTDSFDDKLFDDVVMYESNPADYSDSGVYKCLERCKGTCLEYGITGNTFCFPKK
jgi:hypothetical protein